MSDFVSEAADWAEQTHAQVAQELGALQLGVLDRVDALGARLAALSEDGQMPPLEAVQGEAEGFLVDMTQLLMDLSDRLADGLGGRVAPLEAAAHAALRGGGDQASEAVRCLAAAERWRASVPHYFAFVSQYVAGYLQGGGVAVGLMLEMPEGEFSNEIVVAQVVRHRLLFLSERAELAATQWAEEVSEELAEVAARIATFQGASPQRSPQERLAALLALAETYQIQIKKVPTKPSHGWLDRMEEKLGPVVERRKLALAQAEERGARREALLAFADRLHVRLRKVPERPSATWLDKVQAKLIEVAERKGVPLPAALGGEPEPTTADLAPAREAAPIKAPSSEEPEDDALTPGGVERVAAPEVNKISPEERAERIAAMTAKAERAEIQLGRVPDEPSDAWLEQTEAKLKEALAERKAKRKAERKRRQAQRQERIERLKRDAEQTGVEIGRIPPFPTDDWLARAEMRVADKLLRASEGEASNDHDRAERLRAVLKRADELGVELGELPPDPDRVWITWAEGRVADEDLGDELIAAGEDPDEPEKQKQAVLLYEEGTIQERVWVIEEELFNIGRARASHAQIRDDAGVSRRHATIVRVDDSYFLQDNGSTKGTLVNGLAISRDTLLEGGERIRVGSTELIFRFR